MNCSKCGARGAFYTQVIIDGIDHGALCSTCALGRLGCRAADSRPELPEAGRPAGAGWISATVIAWALVWALVALAKACA